jgi:GNAT superfamily N-acetyltransferase
VAHEACGAGLGGETSARRWCFVGRVVLLQNALKCTCAVPGRGGFGVDGAAGAVLRERMTTPPENSAIHMVQADFARPEHQAAVLAMVDAYSRDPMGDGAPLSAEARARLIPGLRRHATTLVFLAYDGETPVGVAVCFLGFSTFAAKPLVNLHDVAVVPAHRGRGVGRALLGAVEAKARELGCCKLTLEVLDKNERALRTYTAAGFKRYALQPGAGEAIFLTKGLQ